MRLILDITKTHSGRYEGHLTVPGTADRQDFAGILELLAILERLVYPDKDEDATSAEPGGGAGRDGITDRGAPR